MTGNVSSRRRAAETMPTMTAPQVVLMPSNSLDLTPEKLQGLVDEPGTKLPATVVEPMVGGRGVTWWEGALHAPRDEGRRHGLPCRPRLRSSPPRLASGWASPRHGGWSAALLGAPVSMSPAS